MKNCPALPEWNLISLCNGRVKSVPADLSRKPGIMFSPPIVQTTRKAFFKKENKNWSELAFLPHCLHDFWRKIFILLYSIYWLNFTVWLLWLLEVSGNECIVIVCFPGCDVKNFEINIGFLIKSTKTQLSSERAFKAILPKSISLLKASSHFATWRTKVRTKIWASKIEKGF